MVLFFIAIIAIFLLAVGICIYLQTDNSIIGVIASYALMWVGIYLILSISSLSDKMKAEKRPVEEHQIQSLDFDDGSKRNDSDFVIGYGSKISHGKTIKYYVVRVKQKSGNYTVKKYRASKVTLRFNAKDTKSASVRYSRNSNNVVRCYNLRVPESTVLKEVDFNKY